VEKREGILVRFQENMTVTRTIFMKLKSAPRIFLKTSYPEFDEFG
jgi:hypothetical protein